MSLDYLLLPCLGVSTPYKGSDHSSSVLAPGKKKVFWGTVGQTLILPSPCSLTSAQINIQDMKCTSSGSVKIIQMN